MKVMKSGLFILLAIFSSCLSFASGFRDLEVTLESIEHFHEIEPLTMNRTLHYLGSTQHWHLFGETLTSVSADMPYDNTYGYKVKAKELNIKNGWFFTLEKVKYRVKVSNCPKVKVYAKEAQARIQISRASDNEDTCILYKEKVSY